MREIKFRGLRSLDNKWLYGSLVTGLFHNVNTKVEYCNIMDAVDYPNFDCFQDFDNMDTDVNPDSVGQFTGLKDKNGVKIYEGDIVTRDCYPFKDADTGRNYVATIEWVFNSWQYILHCVNPLKRGISDGMNEHIEDEGQTEFEVIGNIHQNPELL